MGLNNLPTRANGQNVDETWFNRIKSALVGVFVPRTSLGVPEAEIGSVGTETYRWKKAFISSGHLFLGAIKMKYRYTSVSVPIDKGWMLCDGRIITEANYDAEHGAGSWVSHGVAASSIAGKYLPNFDAKYLRGVLGDATQTQDGNSAITTVGAASVSVGHTHSGGTMTSSQSNNATPSLLSVGDLSLIGVLASHTHNVTIDSHVQTVTLGPKAIEMNLYMRVI